MTAYIVFAHGSSVETANDAVRAVAREAARRGGWLAWSAAFLGGGTPDLRGAVESLSERADRFVVIPYFLTPGLHLERDLPMLIDEIRREHPRIVIESTPPLDGHPAMIEAVVERARTCDSSL